MLRFTKKTAKVQMILSFASLVLITNASSAVQIPIANHSFEAPGIPAPPADQYIVGVPTDWTDNGSNDPFVETNAALNFVGGDGLQYAGMNGGEIYQDLGVPFQANLAYQVDIAGVHRNQFDNGYMEFGIYSSDAIGIDLGITGFIDIQGFWAGSGNPDGDDVFDTFRDASVLAGIGGGNLGRTSQYIVGSSAPTGNIVVFIRKTSGFRANFDNIRLESVSGIVAGDVTGEGTVDLADYVIIRDNFRLSGLTRTQGDLNGDGTADFTDFLEWRNESPFAGLSFAELDALSQAVPEPSSCFIALAASLAVSLRRKQR